MIIKKDHLNFAVGPVMMSDEIMKLGADPVPYFRTKDFSALMLENEQLMKKFVSAKEDSRVVFLTGSGTAAMDAAVNNLFSREDKLLVINGGSFGHRFCEICDAYAIEDEEIKLDNGKALTYEHLSPYAGKGFTGLLVNMDETSTGVLYDVKMIGDFCKENNMVYVVDAISAFLTDEINMTEIGADVVLTGSQKALALAPGVAIMVLSQRAVTRVMSNKPFCYYLDLKSALVNMERGQTPFTPAVGILIQLNARLNQIDSITLNGERENIKAVADDFRERIKKYPFRIVSESLSNAVTPLSPLNPEVSAYKIFETLKEEYDIIVCPNGGDLAHKVFRVGHMGSLTVKDNDRLFAALDDLVKRGIIKE